MSIWERQYNLENTLKILSKITNVLFIGLWITKWIMDYKYCYTGLLHWITTYLSDKQKSKDKEGSRLVNEFYALFKDGRSGSQGRDSPSSTIIDEERK